MNLCLCRAFFRDDGVAPLFRGIPRKTQNTRKFSGITEQSRKSRKYVVLEFRDVCVLFRDVSACSVFSVGGNTINDEGGMARGEERCKARDDLLLIISRVPYVTTNRTMQYFPYDTRETDALKAADPILGEAIDRLGHPDRPLMPDLFAA